MKRGIIIWALIILGVIFIGYAATKVRFTGNQILSIEKINSVYSVKIENSMYVPNELNIKVGETVEWKNLDSLRHTVTSNDAPLNSAVINPGENYSFTFEKEGEYDYYCMLHQYVRGKIIVK